MKLVLTRSLLKPILRWTQRVLFAVGISLLSYVTFVLTDAWLFQRAEGRKLERLLQVRQESKRAAPPAASPVQPDAATAVADGGLVGRIAIPRLELSLVVVEGVSRTDLRRAVGHIPGTSLPGRPGNVGIAGHRDTFFRPLRNIRFNDAITLTTLSGEYSYRVVSTRIVRRAAVEVLHPDGNQILTLVTCYPFDFVGAAPLRFIVRAERSN